MSFDGILTHAVKDELSATIESGKITKIYQLNQYELLFTIRGNSKNSHLLLSAHPSYSRVHLTTGNYDKPFEPPMFCMLLRKHLEGGIVEKVEQVDFERILVFHIRSRNELGDVSYKKLIVEIMNKHSNIIVVDRDTNKIIDSIKHLSPALNRHRTVMPGSEYIEPPKQHKLHPLHATEEDILKKVDFNSGKLAMQLVENFVGISPLIANEIVHLAGLANATSLPKAFLEVMRVVNEANYEPQIVYSDAGKELFYVLPLTHIAGEKKTFATVSEMLDRFYGGKAERDRVKQQAADLERFIKNEWNKNKRKVKKLQKTLKDAEKAEAYKLHGELLTAHMYLVKRGDTEVTVTNFYDDSGENVTIALDPQKSPSENAQNFFKKYQKAKTSLLEVEKQLLLTNEEIIYFEGLLQQVESASLKDILEIREELIEGGYLKKSKKTSKKKTKLLKPIIEKYRSSDGFEILVGKNNKQNDYLTNKMASQDDLWFHTKDIPGSHVVIKGKAISEEAILEAANIAAFYSKARQSSSVPVDYTKIRHVKKPSGAKPGYVIYDKQQTVYVTPSEDLVLQLKEK